MLATIFVSQHACTGGGARLAWISVKSMPPSPRGKVLKNVRRKAGLRGRSYSNAPQQSEQPAASNKDGQKPVTDVLLHPFDARNETAKPYRTRVLKAKLHGSYIHTSYVQARDRSSTTRGRETSSTTRREHAVTTLRLSIPLLHASPSSSEANLSAHHHPLPPRH